MQPVTGYTKEELRKLADQQDGFKMRVNYVTLSGRTGTSEVKVWIQSNNLMGIVISSQGERGDITFFLNREAARRWVDSIGDGMAGAAEVLARVITEYEFGELRVVRHYAPVVFHEMDEMPDSGDENKRYLVKYLSGEDKSVQYSVCRTCQTEREMVFVLNDLPDELNDEVDYFEFMKLVLAWAELEV